MDLNTTPLQLLCNFVSPSSTYKLTRRTERTAQILSPTTRVTIKDTINNSPGLCYCTLRLCDKFPLVIDIRLINNICHTFWSLPLMASRFNPFCQCDSTCISCQSIVMHGIITIYVNE